MNYDLQYQPPAYLQTPEQRQMGMWLHLSQLANLILFPVGVVLPIVLWQVPASIRTGKWSRIG